MKKILVSCCKECKYYYNPETDPYPDVGWAMDKCTKMNKILWKDMRDTIPEWCPLPDDT